VEVVTTVEVLFVSVLLSTSFVAVEPHPAAIIKLEMPNVICKILFFIEMSSVDWIFNTFANSEKFAENISTDFGFWIWDWSLVSTIKDNSSDSFL
jgi:hypothetical protein